MVSRDFFGADAKFHHVGLVVQSIAQLASDTIISEDEIQNVRVAFIVIGGARIELVEPLSDDSPVSRNLRSGAKLLHLCFEVDQIEEAVSRARENGFRLIAHAVPAVAFGGRRIAWVYSSSWGLIELLER